MLSIAESTATGSVQPLLERPACLAPWLENPYGLVSWLAMLEYSAESFVWCGSVLRAIRSDCQMASAVILNGSIGIDLSRDLDDIAKKKVLAALPSLERNCRHIGLSITADTVKELGDDIRADGRHSFQWLIDQALSVERLAYKELKGKLFLYVPPERARFWPKIDERYVFGETVANAFPSSTFDANNAGVCLATLQSTASVFHLMRVLEIGLTVLGAVFGVSLAHTNWAPAIEEIESKVRNMHKDPAWKSLPDCKEQQAFYAQAASHFGILKDAWRNHVMHVRGKYTEQEAERIFENVKSFMQNLAVRLHE